MIVFSTFLPMAILCVSSVFSFPSNETLDDILQRWRVNFERDHPECLTQSNVTEAELNGLWKKLQYSDSRDFKCYLDCMYRSYNLYNEDGSFGRDAIVKTFERVTYESFDVCNARVVTTERCEMVFHFDSCLVRYDEAYGV